MMGFLRRPRDVPTLVECGMQQRGESETSVLRAEVSALRAELSDLSDLVARKTARPYYTLNDGWALTHLDTGQPFFCNTRDRSITPWLLMGGHWETHVDRVLTDLVQPGMRVVDVGANMGYYTVKLAHKAGPHGHILAFEPNPDTLPYLRENIAINNLHARVTLYDCALGADEGRGTLGYVAGGHAQANLVGAGTHRTTHEVSIIRADDALHGQPIDVMKIDAEGFERDVLLGAQETIRRSPKCVIVMECSLDRWPSLAGCDELVQGRAPHLIEADSSLTALSPTALLGRLHNAFLQEAYVAFLPREHTPPS